MHYGLNADRDALPDVDVLADAMPDALAELRASRARRPRQSVGTSERVCGSTGPIGASPR